MLKYVIGLLVAVGFAIPAAAQDPVLGIWKTEPDDGAFAHVELGMCGSLICGTIVRTFNSDGEYQSDNIGKDIVRDMAAQGNGRYSGTVWRPSNNKLYKGRLVLKGTSLQMKGCVAGGLLCASQNWERVQ